MSTYLRKCIDLAPTAVITPGPTVANDYRNVVTQPWWPALRATTSHIRLWADWPSLQQVPDQPPGFGEAAARSLAALDAQVKAASDDGLNVILLPYRYPNWANGTEGIVNLSQQDNDFEPWNRVSRVAQYRDWLAGLRVRPTYKALRYRLAVDGHGADSAWGAYVAWLWDRYVGHADVYGRAAAFEVVNEPNLQLWPQRSVIDTPDVIARWGVEGTHLVVTAPVAEMMVTMDAIARDYGGDTVCLAPSAADSDIDDIPRSTTISHRNPYADTEDPFVDSLLTELERRGFAGGDRWVWSFHNYADVERKQQHVVHLRRVLIERGWAGRQLDGGPELWSTEGGCRLASTNTRFSAALGHTLSAAEQRAYQALVVTEALSRHHYAKGAGAGVGLFTQYTTFADPNFDSGVLEPFAGIAVPRPALAAWTAVPEYVAAPVQRPAWRAQF